MKIIIEHNNIRMVEIEIDKEIKKFKYQDPEYQNIQREYRKNYYQDNKNKISNYFFFLGSFSNSSTKFIGGA